MEIKFDKRNYRKHSEQNKKRIKKSLKECGAGRSVLVDADDTLIAGNGVFEQAKAMGIPTRVVETDGTELVVVKRTDLRTDDDKRKLLAMADNATSDSVEWDMETLNDDFDVDVLADWDIKFDLSTEQEPQEAHEDDFDEEKDHVETICQEGDVWQLGNHRLMCGDSTKAEDFERLMDGQKADLTFTSPPYNAGCLDLKGRESAKRKYMNDADTKTNEQYLAFLSSNVELLLKYSDEVFYNIGVVSGSKVAILGLLYEYRDKFKDFIYWKKNNPVNCIAKGVISSAVELIMCFGENNSRSFKDTHFQNGEYYLGVIEGNTASNNEYAKIHKATFPMYLPENIIRNFSSKGSAIIDCFGGTGTTLIAAEQLGRKCYMMELDPHYCDVIIARWEKLTGKKAVKL